MLLSFVLFHAALAEEREEDKLPSPMRMHYEFAADSLGATPGGAQDIGHFRDRVHAGEVPMPQTITTEGLFSEHDLPLDGSPCKRLLCTNAKAVPARLATQPDVGAMVQLGFTSGLDPETFRRPPLNIIAVVDQSCSMGGAPIDIVRASLSEMVSSHLQPQDQLSIVLYGSDVHTWLAPTDIGNRTDLLQRIADIPIDGSTNMEAGLLQGFAVARESQRTFDGATRVMLFTDERPNTGATDPDSFMGLARSASADGIGMTTFGVGVQFGAELAQQISAVRGGNLVFFSDVADMKARLHDDFPTLVTELAYDMDVSVQASEGLRIAGVYGVPGDMVTWTEQGISLHLETLFLSTKQGGIYLALAPKEGQSSALPSSVGHIELSYLSRDGARDHSARTLTTVRNPSQADIGLLRGPALVDEATTLIDATERYHQHNDADGAWQRVHALGQRLAANPDPALEPERILVAELEHTLATLAGRASETTTVAERDPKTGLPRR